MGMLLALGWPAGSAIADDDTLTLSIHPILPPEETRSFYAPLASFLEDATGKRVEIRTDQNFFAYWQSMQRQQGFDLVLDAAHFTDYRLAQMNYEVLAKQPATVTQSLVTRPELLVFDPEDLIGQPVATAAAPSLAATILQSQIYPNTLQQPAIREAPDSITALEMTMAGEVDAAFVPTPLLANYPELNLVATSDPVPHIAVSASPDVPQEIRDQIREALLNADNNTRGNSVLDSLNFQAFEPASASIYEGYSRLLEGTWGYNNQARRGNR